MLVPDDAANASDRGCALRIHCWNSNLCLLTVVSYIKVFQVDKHFRSNRKDTVKPTLSNRNDDSTCFVLQCYFVIEVTCYVRACNNTFYLQVFGNLLIAYSLAIISVDRFCKLCFEVGNGNYICFCQFVVAVWCWHSLIGFCISVAHARSKEGADCCHHYIFYILHILFLLEFIGYIQHSVDTIYIVFLRIFVEIVCTCGSLACSLIDCIAASALFVTT